MLGIPSLVLRRWVFRGWVLHRWVFEAYCREYPTRNLSWAFPPLGIPDVGYSVREPIFCTPMCRELISLLSGTMRYNYGRAHKLFGHSPVFILTIMICVKPIIFSNNCISKRLKDRKLKLFS